MSDSIASKILLVEDEKNVGSTLLERFEQEGFEAVWVKTQKEALCSISTTFFDLAVLDIGLLDGSGFEVAQFLRLNQPRVAVVFLTAFGNAEDRIKGLELGAEDYIVKPFHLKELILRMRNGLKRARYLTRDFSLINTVVMVGRAKIDFLRFEAEVEGKKVSLTHKETALLKLFVERQGKVVSRDEILNHAWSEDEYPTPRTVDNFVMRLRRLVEVNPEAPEKIKSIRGIGYQFL